MVPKRRDGGGRDSCHQHCVDLGINDLPHGAVTGSVISTFYEVFRELGHGFSNVVYRRAMGIALREAGHAVMEEGVLPVFFRGRLIGDFRADLIVDRAVIVEVKPARDIEKSGEAQVLNYLKAAGGGVGLLLNFGQKPEFRRFVLGNPEKSLPLLP